MKIVEVENNRYELIDNYKDGFDMNEFRKTFKSIDIHSDGITLLYVP